MRMAWMVLLLLAVPLAAGDDAPEKSPTEQKAPAAKEWLSPLKRFVGEWKGAGQVQRGSAKGAWAEDASWRWEFDGDRTLIAFEAPDGKHFVKGAISPANDHESDDDDKDGFVLEATPPESEEALTFRGQAGDDGEFVFTRTPSEGADETSNDDRTARITLRLVADGDRLVMLLERRIRASGRFVRLAEVGYTRQGGDFAKNARGPECVVTGGLGVIEVEFQGRKYYVCCTGCRDAFNEDPQKILAEYEARRKAEQEE